MILVDTSIWIDHLARGDAGLQVLLEEGEVVTHPYIVGELALGSLARREETLRGLNALPTATVASPAEVMEFLQAEKLFGTSIGYVDLHLLASTRLDPATLLWTRDKRLLTVATRLKIAAFATH